MRLWEKFKRLMPNRKKARVRKADYQPPKHVMTVAERLIMNNWGIRFDFTPSKRAGEMRAHERLSKKLKANKSIPVLDKPHSRQVIRAAERRDFKAIRSMVKAEQRRKKRNDRDVPKGAIPV